MLEQEAGDPLADTTVHVRGLVYSDGSHNDTSGHDWSVHDAVPGKDFYDWQNRCASAGGEFNPYRVATGATCGPLDQQRCTVGHVSGRQGTLNVAGSIETITKQVRFCTIF